MLQSQRPPARVHVVRAVRHHPPPPLQHSPLLNLRLELQYLRFFNFDKITLQQININFQISQLELKHANQAYAKATTIIGLTAIVLSSTSTYNIIHYLCLNANVPFMFSEEVVNLF